MPNRFFPEECRFSLQSVGIQPFFVGSKDRTIWRQWNPISSIIFFFLPVMGLTENSSSWEVTSLKLPNICIYDVHTRKRDWNASKTSYATFVCGQILTLTLRDQQQPYWEISIGRIVGLHLTWVKKFVGHCWDTRHHLFLFL